MKILIVTAGSTGDVRPYMALGTGLNSAGHRVRIITHEGFQEWIEGHGLETGVIHSDPRTMIEQGTGQEWLETGQNGLAFIKGFRDQMQESLAMGIDETLEAAADFEPDLIIASAVAYYIVHPVHKKTGIKWVQTFLQPVHVTSAYPSAMMPLPFRTPKWLNKATHSIGGMMFWRMIAGTMNKVLEEKGIEQYGFAGPFPEVEAEKTLTLYGYSPSFLPKPDDWPDHAHVTGYWFLDEGEGWQPPHRLVDFLKAGSQPVYVGFGSMSNRDPAETTRIVVEALQRAGQRGVLLSGWSGLATKDLPNSIVALDYAPHDWLFPKMAAVVHHGGAGTTAAGLRAGVPNVIVPFFGDQPWWGARVNEAGAGPAPIQRQELTADQLVDAIRQAVSNEEMCDRSAALGEKIRAEDGVMEAVRLIEKTFE